MSAPHVTRPLTDEARELPLLVPTPRAWADLAASHLEVFLADHAVCEQQAALSALNLVAHYPADGELVRAMIALAAEEVHHLQRVVRILHRRGLEPARRRPNEFVSGLRRRIQGQQEPELKVDRLLVGALIEARSCERFTLLGQTLQNTEGQGPPRDAEVTALLNDLGPAEKRHWELFHGLASREMPATDLDRRWRDWLEHERDLMRVRGIAPTVHG